MFAYVGSDTSAIDGNANGKGIYLFEMDIQQRATIVRQAGCRGQKPLLALSRPVATIPLCLNEISDFEGKSGSVSAYAVDNPTAIFDC